MPPQAALAAAANLIASRSRLSGNGWVASGLALLQVRRSWQRTGSVHALSCMNPPPYPRTIDTPPEIRRERWAALDMLVRAYTFKRAGRRWTGCSEPAAPETGLGAPSQTPVAEQNVRCALALPQRGYATNPAVSNDHRSYPSALSTTMEAVPQVRALFCEPFLQGARGQGVAFGHVVGVPLPRCAPGAHHLRPRHVSRIAVAYAFLRAQFGGQTTNTTTASRDFGLNKVPTPREIVAALDQYVIGQAHTKKVG